MLRFFLPTAFGHGFTEESLTPEAFLEMSRNEPRDMRCVWRRDTGLRAISEEMFPLSSEDLDFGVGFQPALDTEFSRLTFSSGRVNVTRDQEFLKLRYALVEGFPPGNDDVLIYLEHAGLDGDLAYAGDPPYGATRPIAVPPDDARTRRRRGSTFSL
jgi:hypothetical protein